MEEFLVYQTKRIKKSKSDLEKERDVLLKLLGGTVDASGELVSPIQIMNRSSSQIGLDIKVSIMNILEEKRRRKASRRTVLMDQRRKVFVHLVFI